MSRETQAGWLASFRLDTLAAVGGLFFALLVIPLQFVSRNLFVVGIPVAVGIASVLYLISLRTDHGVHGTPLPSWTARLFPSVCVLGMAGLILIAVSAGSRTIGYYNLAIVVAVLIFYQIIFTREADFSVPLVLGQVVLLAFVLRFSALYTGGFVGVDIWTHVPNWTAGIIETNSLAPLEGRKYYAAPIFHLLVASVALFADLDLEPALHLSVGLVLPLVVLLVYASTRIFMDPRWSTFAAAITAVIGYMMQWSIHLIPTSLGLAFFAGIFYLLCRLLYYRFDRAEFFLLVVLNIAVVLTHQIATFITLVLLFASVLTLLLLPSGLFSSVRGQPGPREARLESANLAGLFIFDVGFVTLMWSLTPLHGSSFLATTLIWFQDTLQETEGFGDLAGEREAEGAPPVEGSTLEQVIAVIDASVFLLLFLLVGVGVLYVLHRRNLSYPTFMMGTSIVVMSIFVFGFPMFGIRQFIPTRWYAFMAIPMIILAAFGIAHLSRNLNSTTAVVLLLCFVLVFPATAIISTSATMDSPRFESEQTRYSYTAAELAAVETVDERFQATGADGEETALHTDHPYQTVFERTEAHESAMIELSEDGLAEADLLVYRAYQSSGGAYFNDEFDRAYRPAVSFDVVCGGERSSVYDNGEVTICT